MATADTLNVSGKKDSGYSLYVDCYPREGAPLYGQAIAFDNGTHDWQSGELRIRPTVPIQTATVYCMFRWHTGTVWFDDVSLAKASAPDDNLLDRGGFEPEVPRATTAVTQEANRRLEQIRQGILQLKSAAQLEGLVRASQGDLAWRQSQPNAAGARDERDFRDVVDLLRVADVVAKGGPSPGFLPARLLPQPR